MDWKLFTLIIGILLTIGGGIVTLRSKLVKKADKPEKKQEVKTEKEFAWWTFIVSVILAQALTFSSGFSTWSSTNETKHFTDSVNHVSDSLRDKLVRTQDSLVVRQDTLKNLASLQIEKAIVTLKVATDISTKQQQTVKSLIDITKISIESKNQITGGGNYPFVVVEAEDNSGTPGIIMNTTTTVKIALVNKRPYIIRNLSGYIMCSTLDNDRNSDSTLYRKYPVYRPTMTKGLPIIYMTQTIKASFFNPSLRYFLTLKWDNGELVITFNLKKEGNNYILENGYAELNNERQSNGSKFISLNNRTWHGFLIDNN